MTIDIGARIREYRDRYGLSQAQLGARIDRSREWVSKVENGALIPDNYRVLIDLAAVFHCRVADLTGEPLSLAPNGGAAGLDLSGLRAAILPYATLGELTTAEALDAAYVADLGRDATRLRQLRQESRYSELATALPELIRSTERATREHDGEQERRRAFAVLSHVYHVAGAVAQRVGDMELSWVTSDRALTAAERGDDAQLVAIASRRVANALLRAGRAEDAATVSLAAARAFETSSPNRTATPEGVSVRGALYLKAAVGASRAGDGAEAWRLLAEAARDADRVAPDANHAWTAYNATNVALHGVDIAMENGDPDDALRRADRVDPTVFPPNLVERRCRLYVDVARAYAMRGNDAAAVSSLLQAESIAPEEVCHQTVVRALVRTFMRHERKTSMPGLRRLAQRVGAGR